MDELPEFRRNVLEVLRQPMEGRMMTISMAKFSIDYPASFMLVAITTTLHAIVNAQINPALMSRYCKLDTSASYLVKNAMERLDFSARAYDRILKVSRTIADLDGSEIIQANHLAEAVNYRNLDRKGWGG